MILVCYLILNAGCCVCLFSLEHMILYLWKPFSEISMPVEPQRAHLRVQELEDVVSREYKRFQDKERNE